MAYWDKYEGRNPFAFDDETHALLELKPSDSLFESDPQSSVWIDSPFPSSQGDGPEWSTYAWGFKDAADRLIEDLVREGNSSLSTRFLANASLTLYRHSVELAIKSILITAGAGRKPEQIASHDLNVLWERAVEAMKREGSRIDGDESLALVGSLIAELNAADANSENFRYGANRKLQPYKGRLEHVDVVNLRRVMNQVVSALESCDTWLYEARQARSECEAEMRQESYAAMQDFYGS